MNHLATFESYFGQIAFIQQEDPDHAISRHLGNDHVLDVKPGIQFDKAKVLALMQQDDFLARTAAQLTQGIPFPDTAEALGETQIEMLKQVFDNVIIKSDDLRQKYQGLP
jgi:hypothetical protein